MKPSPHPIAPIPTPPSYHPKDHHHAVPLTPPKKKKEKGSAPRSETPPSPPSHGPPCPVGCQSNPPTASPPSHPPNPPSGGHKTRRHLNSKRFRPARLQGSSRPGQACSTPFRCHVALAWYLGSGPVLWDVSLLGAPWVMGLLGVVCHGVASFPWRGWNIGTSGLVGLVVI